MKFVSTFLTVALTLATSLVNAADDAAVRLASVHSLRCSFGPGSQTDWSKGKPVTKSARFDVVLQFDSINTQAGTARLIGNAGASDVAVWLTAKGMTFMALR
jgi:hypothetical protein